MATAQPHLRLLAIVICAHRLRRLRRQRQLRVFQSHRTDIHQPSFRTTLHWQPSTGAVITGRISGIDLSQSGQSGGVTAPRVGIAPPGISTVVGRDGNFTLTGVPPGTVTLIFSDNGISAGILLTNVGVNQLIVLDVRVNSGVATIESEHRRNRD